MSMILSFAAAAVAANAFFAPEVSQFPRPFFNTVPRQQLQRRAMETWPGPAQILRMWRAGDLDVSARRAVLLGMAASHDPILLPLYREAVSSDEPELRAAAAYGYRDLIADGLPDVSAGVDPEAAARLATEIELVGRTLRSRTLTELWLQALLAAEGGALPGWSGLVLQRPTGVCFNALEKVIGFEDFALLAAAYRITSRDDTRLGLLRLLEAVTLQQFFHTPSDGRTGWGMKDVREGFEAADEYLAYWLDRRCVSDPAIILRTSLAQMGAKGVDPFAPDSWEVWLRVFKTAHPGWRMMAARQLFELGGRWAPVSMFQAASSTQSTLRDDLLAWYRLLPKHMLDRRKPPRGD